jgi:hypothetical protein
MKVASESDEFASSTAWTTFCSKTSALEDTLGAYELVLEYEYSKEGARRGGLRISMLGGDSRKIGPRSSYEQYDAGLPSEDAVAERGQLSGLLAR